MIETRHNSLSDHVLKIENLKKKVIEIYKEDESKALGILKKMRIIHGCAIMDNDAFLDTIKTMDENSITDDDWIRLSTNDSLLRCMHSQIRCCEKKMYHYHKGNKASELLSSETEEFDTDVSSEYSESDTPTESTSLETQSSNLPSFSYPPRSISTFRNNSNTYKERLVSSLNNNKVTGKLFKRGDSDELSLYNYSTETENLPHQYENPLESEREVSVPVSLSTSHLGSSRPNTLVDFINGSQTTIRHENLSHRNLSKQNQRGGNKKKDLNKPTLVNYWANWCSASNRFLPEWREFERMALEKFPNLQVEDVDVIGKELSENAKKVGVQGYPTVVLFYDNKIHKARPGGMKKEDIVSFVNSIIHHNK